MPHKTPHGNAALKNLRAYEGCPPPYDKEAKFNLPSANKHLRLLPRRKSCTGEFSTFKLSELRTYSKFSWNDCINFHKFTLNFIIDILLSVGRLSHEVGWQYKDVVNKLEAKRKVKGAKYHEQKKTLLKLKEQVCIFSFTFSWNSFIYRLRNRKVGIFKIKLQMQTDSIWYIIHKWNSSGQEERSEEGGCLPESHRGLRLQLIHLFVFWQE